MYDELLKYWSMLTNLVSLQAHYRAAEVNHDKPGFVRLNSLPSAIN